MMAHHEETLEVAIRQLQTESGAVALLLTGALARGEELPESDVELCLLVTEPNFAAASAIQRFRIVGGPGHPVVRIELATLRQLLDETGPVRGRLRHSRVLWVAEPAMVGDLVQVLGETSDARRIAPASSGGS